MSVGTIADIVQYLFPPDYCVPTYAT